MSIHGPVSVHRLLQFKMHEMGYQVSYQGICAGFVGMWSQAVLTGEQARFHDRLTLLMTLPPNYLNNTMGQLRFKYKDKKLAKRFNIFSSDNIQDKVNELILEIPAFMEGVYFHQENIFDPGYLGVPSYKQDLSLRSSVVSSKKLDDLGGIVEVYNFSGLFLKDDFVKFYQELECAVKQSSSKPPFVVALSNMAHRVALAWDGEAFVFCDINDINILLYNKLKIKNAEDFSEKVTKSLEAKDSNINTWDPSCNAIVGYFYTTGKYYDDIEIIINHKMRYLADPNNIIENRLNKQDGLGATWLHQAVYSEDISMIKALVLAGADVCLNNFNNNSVLFYAIKCRDEKLFDAIKPALVRDPDMLYTNDIYGNNALHIAVFSGNIIALNQIANIYPNIIDLENLSGETPLHSAVMLNNCSAVTMLLCKGADMHYENNSGESPFSIAMTREPKNRRIIEMFELYQKKESAAELVVKIDAFKENSGRNTNDSEIIKQYLNHCRNICVCNHPDMLRSALEEINKLPIPEFLSDDIKDIIESIKGRDEFFGSRLKL